jgi:hypothetical protein
VAPLEIRASTGARQRAEDQQRSPGTLIGEPGQRLNNLLAAGDDDVFSKAIDRGSAQASFLLAPLGNFVLSALMF